MHGFRRILGPAALALVLILPAGASAEESYGRCFLSKAEHGIGNMALGWYEVPKNVINIVSDKSLLCGVTYGLVRGVVHGVTRTVVGAAQFLTSPIPTAEEYVTPPYIWERLSEDTRYWNVHLPGEWTHFGPLDDGGLSREK